MSGFLKEYIKNNIVNLIRSDLLKLGIQCNQQLTKYIYGRELKHYIDPVTNAYRRDLLDQLIDYIIEKKVNQSIMFIDLDDFKTINETYGHHIGDYGLLQTAMIIQKHITKVSDLFRYGGDEFIVLSQILDPKDLHDIGFKIQQELQNVYIANDYNLKITIVISQIQHNSNRQNTYGHLSKLLKRGKLLGKNKIIIDNIDDKIEHINTTSISKLE